MTLPLQTVNRCAALLAILVALLVNAQLEAQTPLPARDFRTGMRTGVGYTGAMPDALFGVGVFHLVADRPIGVFADWKMTTFSGIRNDDEYCPSTFAECTNLWVLEQRNDQHVGDAREWLAFNAGIVYALTREFSILLGGGLARETLFQQYFDDNEDQVQRVTDSGSYYVDDDLPPEWKAQAVGGFLVRAGRSLAFRIGYETAIGGLGFGAYFVIP